MDRPNDMQPARAEATRLTYDDFLAFPDDGRRHELIDGDHVVAPAPDDRHQEVAGRLFLALGNFIELHPLGKVYFAPLDIILSDFDVVEPDILFVSNERRGIIRGSVHGAPDLAVEIVSPSSRRVDEIRKRDLYDRFGVREYWVVDPEIEAVKVYRRTAARSFQGAIELTREKGDSLETPLLPGFAVPLVHLFA